MPGTRYSVFNPDGESFVPDQDKFNAQLQQMAMTNMGNLAGVQERAREFNIGDQTNRWNAQAQYGLGSQQLAQSGHQFDSSQNLMRELALANLSAQKDQLGAQMEVPRAQLAMQQQQYGEQAPARKAELALTQAKLAKMASGEKYLAGAQDAGTLDPVKAILAGGGDVASAVGMQQGLVNQQANPLLQQADRDIQTNTPGSRKHLGGLQQQLQAMGYKGIPQPDQVEKPFEEWSQADPNFTNPLNDASGRLQNYVKRADTWTDDPDVGPDRGEIVKDVDLMRQAATKQGYSVADANRKALLSLQTALAPHQKAKLWGTRTPYGASSIDSLAQQLGLGAQFGGSSGMNSVGADASTQDIGGP